MIPTKMALIYLDFNLNKNTSLVKYCWQYIMNCW